MLFDGFCFFSLSNQKFFFSFLFLICFANIVGFDFGLFVYLYLYNSPSNSRILNGSRL